MTTHFESEPVDDMAHTAGVLALKATTGVDVDPDRVKVPRRILSCDSNFVR